MNRASVSPPASTRTRAAGARALELTALVCCWDLLDSNILNCDERRYIPPNATVLIGSFAALMVWQSYCDDPCLAYHHVPSCLADLNAGRLLIGVRGDTSLTYVDVVP